MNVYENILDASLFNFYISHQLNNPEIAIVYSAYFWLVTLWVRNDVGTPGRGLTDQEINICEGL